MRKALLALVVAGVLLVVVALWVVISRPGPDRAARPHPSSVAAATLPPARPPLTSPTPAPTSARVDADGKPATGDDEAKAPTAKTGSAWQTAARTATDFVSAYARPPAGTSSATWWRKVSSYLTDQARLDYQGVDPAVVPYSHVTGRAKVLAPQGEDDLVLLVRVPTDAGNYIVHLLPDTGGGPAVSGAATRWKVSRLSPPSQR